MRIWVLVLLLASTVTMARGQSPQEPEEAPWTVTLTLVGGPNQLNREITLTNLGAVTAIDRTTTTTIDEQLSEDETDTMSRLARSYSPNDLTSATCTNCVTYTLKIAARGQTYSTTFTERQLASSGAENLVRALSRVLTRILVVRP